MTALLDYCCYYYPTPRRAIIALDLDGTLLLPDESIPQSAIDALSEAVEAGAAVVITTGRRYRAARYPVANLPFPYLLLLHNGALLKDHRSHATIDLVGFPEGLIAPIWESLIAQGLAPVAHLDRYDDPPEIWTVPPLAGSYHEQNVRERYAGIAHIAPESELPIGPVIQILAFGTPKETEAAAASLAAEYDSRLYVHSMRVPQQETFVLEVLHPEGGKWSGVQRIATALDVPIGRIVAVGDDANDIAMLRGAGVGVAMGNATEAARAASDVQVASNIEHGIAEAVKRHLRPMLG